VIRTAVFAKFTIWKDKRIIVHDRDLKEAALIEARKLKFDSFQASDTWVRRFKHAHGIVSRKIVRFVTEKSLKERVNTKAAASAFVEGIRNRIKTRPPNMVSAFLMAARCV
jgi:hypothetical protein